MTDACPSMTDKFLCALGHMLSTDDKTVDSVIVLGAIGLGALILFQLLAMAMGGASQFGAVSFAAGVTGIVGSIAGGKRWRDGPTNGPTDKSGM